MSRRGAIDVGHDEWVSAHLFYHGDQDSVIVHLIPPIVAELADGGDRPDFFFLRYWDAGPHVRLRVRAKPGDHDRVRHVIEARCRTFFRARPSTDTVGQEEYEKTAALLAHAEGMTGFTRELAPNNSVSFIPYRRENRRYGRAAMAAVEKHFVDSSRIVLSMLSAGVTPKQRITAVVAMYLIVWFRLGRSALREGDHADLFARQRDILLPLGRRMRALVEQTDRMPPDDGLAGWSQTMAGLQKELDLRRQPAVMTTCAHLAANRLGVDLLSERYASSLATRTVLDMGEGEQPA
jgi:thiopeptide-type bacteriocin biosynthesis protein